MFTCVLGRSVAFTVLVVPKPFGGHCPFSGVTSSGRVWRKVPESDTWSVSLRLTYINVWIISSRCCYSVLTYSLAPVGCIKLDEGSAYLTFPVQLLAHYSQHFRVSDIYRLLTRLKGPLHRNLMSTSREFISALMKTFWKIY